MRKVTISLDDETARWVRIEAAKRDMSVSRLVGVNPFAHEPAAILGTNGTTP